MVNAGSDKFWIGFVMEVQHKARSPMRGVVTTVKAIAEIRCEMEISD